jgi:alpha-D-ribose 1-methylphosphonate 5-triphosphate synthase subunit PhnH
MSQNVDLKPGFGDPVTSAQGVFRRVLDALSRPGRIERIESDLDAPAPLDLATASICLSLIDVDTSLWIAPALHSPEAEAFLKFHCGCPIAKTAAEASFALVDGNAMPNLAEFNPGDQAYPETSTTVIVQVDSLDGPAPDGSRRSLTLSGPGVEVEHIFSVSGLRRFAGDWSENSTLFPCGVDLILTAGDRVVGMPRTVTIKDTDEESGPCTLR